MTSSQLKAPVLGNRVQSSSDLMANSGIDLNALYNMPLMNLQPNFYHQTGPQQSPQQATTFSIPAVRPAPPIPKPQSGYQDPFQPIPQQLSSPAPPRVVSAASFEEPGALWDDPFVTTDSGTGFSGLDIFEKNSSVVEKAIPANDGLDFTPIEEIKKDHSENREAKILVQDESTTEDYTRHSADVQEDNKPHDHPGIQTWLDRLRFGSRSQNRADEIDSNTDTHAQQVNKYHGGLIDPFFRFSGDGQCFRAKLFGYLQVPQPRGDKMCQDALQELKFKIRAAGVHKQRIQLQVTLDGLKIKDEKSGDLEFHHPVEKISFIIQDLNDSRAFGYVFGTPEQGLHFFGIKTEKAASQVVLALKDLFQTVFELKKKTMELEAESDTKNATEDNVATFPDADNDNDNIQFDSTPDETHQETSTSASALSELLGLSLHTDSQPSFFQSTVPNFPNESSGLFQNNFQFQNQQQGNNFGTNPFTSPGFQPQPQREQQFNQTINFFGMQQTPPAASAQFGVQPTLSHGSGFDNSFNSMSGHQTHSATATLGDIFSTTTPTYPSQVTKSDSSGMFSPPMLQPQPTVLATDMMKTNQKPESKPVDPFKDLDPLGIGKSKPFVDKRDFFNDARQPSAKMNNRSPMVQLKPQQPTGMANAMSSQPTSNQKGSLLDFDLL